jgi:hypothetical protein
MTCPTWTWGDENSGNLLAVEVHIYNPEVGAATDFRLYTNVEEVNTGLTQNKRGGIYSDTVTATDPTTLPKVVGTYTDTVTATDPTTLPSVVATYTDTVTTADDFRTCVHFTDRVYANDVLDEDNYAPLKDLKPDAVAPGWKSGGAKSDTAYPMGDVDAPVWQQWSVFPGNKEGPRWPNLDNDVDLTDTTDGAQSQQLVGGEPPNYQLRLTFSGLNANWGTIENITFRVRHTIGACDSGNGTIEYWAALYINGDIAGGALTEDARTFINPAGVTNTVTTITYTGVNLTVLEFNTIACNFSYICRAADGTPLTEPKPTVYAIDLIASRTGYEKVISEDSWGSGKPSASSGWGSNPKTITADDWGDGKFIPGETWNPKE